jgi:(p)ppGpp synthase/HD superfamily hydrolase
MAALRFARRVHLGQHRKQNFAQFVEHPIAVAELISGAGYDGPVLAAAYLHDVVEKTQVEIEEIRERFGPEVAELVEALTDDPSLDDYGERKRELRRRALASGEKAAAIYAADRISNIADWRSIPPEEREQCAHRLGTTLQERLELWDEDVAELSRDYPALAFVAEVESSLSALRAGTPA